MTCEFAKECDLYSPTSFTCTHSAVSFVGGYYCGKARRLAEKKESLNKQVEDEMFFQNTGRCH
jgi:hypothetical protein